MPQNSKNRLPRKNRPRTQRVGPRNFLRSVDSRPYMFYKCVDKGLLTSTTGAEGLYGFSGSLSDLSEVASYTSVFDQYRITQLILHILPAVQLSTTASASPPYSYLYVVTDYDDKTPLASASLALNYQNISIVGPGRGHQRTIRPHVNIYAADDPNTAQPAQSLTSPWLDCAQTNTAHYGFKCSVLQQTSTNIASWRVWIHYSVEFRMVR